MGVVATTLMIDAEEEVPLEEALTPQAVHGIELPEGFVPATKAQVAYWRQLCGAIHGRGTAGMGDTDWPPELAPTRITLRAMEERRLVVRRSRAWHPRRGWFATLTLLKLTAVPTPPLALAERPAPNLPTFAELEAWEHVCRWLDRQPGQRARLPILGVPGLPGTGDVSAETLRGMRGHRLVRHGSDCTWRLSPTWKQRLLALWQGVTKAEGERQPTVPDTPTPYSVAAGIDTWYLNRIDEGGLPPHLRIQLDDLQALAKDEDDEVETPWQYDGTPLLMYRAGVNTTQGGGVSWSYILRNPSLTLLIRKAPLGGIVAQARLGSECLWRRTPRAALDELNLLVRRLWRCGAGSAGSAGDPGQRGRRVTTGSSGRWQVSQVHLAHDVAHAPLELEQLERYVSRSRKQSVFEAARADLAALYVGLDDAHPADAFLEGGLEGLDWDALYSTGDDVFVAPLDPFDLDGGRERRAQEEMTPAEDRAVRVHRFGRRLSGVTWSPGAAVSFVAYDKLLEGRLSGKSHMEPIWRANGWDGAAPVTRHEAQLRRDALRALGVPDRDAAAFDDPWAMLDHLQDLYGYVVGRASAEGAATDCPHEVDVAWLRRVIPDPGEANRSRWPTDPTWAVVQAATFADAPAAARRLVRREVRSDRIERRDRGAYGLLASRTALAFSDLKHWSLSFALKQLYKAFEAESRKPGKAFHELVRRRRGELGLPVPPEERVLPFRSRPSASLPAIDLAVDCYPDETDHDDPAAAGPLALLRAERRLEELDAALDEAAARGAAIGALARAYEEELRAHAALRLRASAPPRPGEPRS
jgi:hypothetical protein